VVKTWRMAQSKLPCREDAAFFTAAEMAMRWKLSYRQIIRLIESKELIAHRFGRVWRIALADLLACERRNRIS